MKLCSGRVPVVLLSVSALLMSGLPAEAGQAAGRGTAAEVRRIERLRKRLESGGQTYRRVTKTVGGTDNGGALTGLFDGKAPVKIHLTLMLSNRTLRNDFYFVQDKLVLVVESSQFFGWDAKKQEMDPAHPQRPTSERYYFRGNKIIHWTKRGRTIDTARHPRFVARKSANLIAESASLPAHLRSDKRDLWVHDL